MKGKINDLQNKPTKILKELIKFLSSNNNIAKEIYRTPFYNDEPKFYNYSIRYQTKYKNDYEIASGISFDRNTAMLKAMGEVIERYALNKYKPVINLTYKSIKEIQTFGNYLNPINISPFSKIQLRKKSFRQFKIDGNSKFNWTKAFSVDKNKEIFIPTQFISFKYNKPNWEKYIYPLTSSGTAFGNKLNDSLYRAICELVERDAFIISYLNKLPSPRIDLKPIKDKHLNKILESLKRYKLEVFVLDLTTDLRIPVIMSIIVDKTGLGPAISIGLKAGFDIKASIIGAIEESLMTRSWIRDKFVYLIIHKRHPKVIKDIEERAYLWFPKKMINNLDFWLKRGKVITLPKFNTSVNFLEKIIKIFKENKMDIVYKDITPSEVKKAGFFVVKVIIPELQALYLDERFKFLGNKRLYEVPFRIKPFNKIRGRIIVNKIPHPFL